MDNTTLMIRLLSRLKSEMNGAMVESMQAKGIRYPLSYGVSAATIRSIAKEYAPNHSLAELLYKQQVRELRLAAATIAEPDKIDSAGVGFWLRGVTTIEIAEHVASFLLCRTGIVKQTVSEWIEDNDEYVRYCIVLTALKSLSFPNAAGKITDGTVSHIVSALEQTTDSHMMRTLVSLIERYAATDAGNRMFITGLLGSISASASACHKYLLSEVSI